MLLLVGLGNPGARYDGTRHNIGFRVAEEAARKAGVALDQKRYDAVVGTGRHAGEQLAIVLPQTFMNQSGTSVAPAARFWKVDPAALVVVHDEVDFEFGRLAVKVGGGDGGHNGLKSLRQHLGTGDYIRIRFGVGRPPPKWDTADYVLGKFSGPEEDSLPELISAAAEAALVALAEGALPAMNRFNRKPKAAGAAREAK